MEKRRTSGHRGRRCTAATRCRGAVVVCAFAFMCAAHGSNAQLAARGAHWAFRSASLRSRGRGPELVVRLLLARRMPSPSTGTKRSPAAGAKCIAPCGAYSDAAAACASMGAVRSFSAQVTASRSAIPQGARRRPISGYLFLWKKVPVGRGSAGVALKPCLMYNRLRNVVWWSVVVGGSDVFSAFRLFGIASPFHPTKNSIPARLLGAASFSGRLARP